MLWAVVSGFLVAFIAPLVHRLGRRAAGPVLALLPLGLFIFFLSHLPDVAAGEVFRHEALTWSAVLDVTVSFYLDGLSLLFALLITGIGTIIVAYAGTYLEDHPDRGRFYVALLSFMASMLGVVLADNLITLFVFWELTSLTSYILIGFDHEKAESRNSALQALLVTALGGLALLAGFVMLGLIGGSFELTELLNEREAITGHGLYVPMLVLVLLGAFTKSAQFPFHFWLPNAMAAPTPVSAYLHSSTMVKAGVYLLARLSPAVGGTEVWLWTLVIVGGVTMVIGAYLAIQQVYLKRILAYSTISALGVLVFLTGMASAEAETAARYAGTAFGAFLLGHALYKATLFLVAGTITHETDEKDVTKLGGLARAMPMTAFAAALAGLSMAGVPPFFGFIGKELLLEAALQQAAWAWLLTAAAVVTGTLFIIVAGLIAWRPFYGEVRQTPKHPHEAPAIMWVGPALLATLSLLIGILPGYFGTPLTMPATASVLFAGGDEAARTGLLEEHRLALWHGINLALLLSVGILVLGVGLFAAHQHVMAALRPVQWTLRIGPAKWYDIAFKSVIGFAGLQTRVLQSGFLRVYLAITILTMVGLVGYGIFRLDDLPVSLELPAENLWAYAYQNLYVLVTAVMILLGTFGAVHSRSRLAAIASLGVVGFGVALIYVFYGAPDLAMTQFLIETLTVILFVLVFYHLPAFPTVSGKLSRGRDVLIALSAGTVMTTLVLIATSVQVQERISDYFVEQAVPLGEGRNVVNVILVDFRSVDTLGEIVVLAIAGVGVLALLKLRPGRKRA